MSGSSITDVFSGNIGIGTNVIQALSPSSFQMTQSSSIISFPSTSDFSFTKGLTALAWVKMNSSLNGTTQVILSKGKRYESTFGDPQFNFFNLTTSTQTNASSAGGYLGTAFDGKYIYFAPFNRPSGPNTGIATRFDITQPSSFASTTSSAWTFFDMATSTQWSTQGTNPAAGYNGAAFDGKYLYFAPYGSTPSGGTRAPAARFDTTQPSLFSSSSSSAWSFSNMSSGPVKNTAALFDGKYVYFSSRSNGIISRFDTTQPAEFTTESTNAWTFFNTQTLTGGSANTYSGSIFDGRYIYFIQNLPSATLARFDTTQPSNFSSTTAGAWTLLNLNNIPGVGGSYPYKGGSYDGKYVYFVSPTCSSGGLIIRLDATQTSNFSTASSSAWTVFKMNTSTQSGGSSMACAQGTVFDGVYLYIPSAGSSGLIARYDTTQPTQFSSTTSSAWNFFNVSSSNSPGGSGALGSFGGIFDGRYVYLAAGYGAAMSTVMTRIDTLVGQSSFELDANVSLTDGFGNSLLGPSFRINTDSGYYSVTSPALIDTNWHLVAGTYDGSKISIYVDGNLVSYQSAEGNITNTTSDLKIGAPGQGNGAFNGNLNSIQIYSRALSQSELSTLYGGGGSVAASSDFCQ